LTFIGPVRPGRGDPIVMQPKRSGGFQRQGAVSLARLVRGHMIDEDDPHRIEIDIVFQTGPCRRSAGGGGVRRVAVFCTYPCGA